MLQNKKIEILKQQITKCVENPIYFLRNYCYVIHPTRGKIKFDLYQFQQKTLKDIQNHKYNIILKSRQLGISTLMAGYSLWLMMFNKDKTIVVIANKQNVAKKLIEKVKIMYDNVPQ